MTGAVETERINSGDPPTQQSLPAVSPNSGGLLHGAGIFVDNPTPHRLPEGENAAPLEVIGTTASDKLIIIMVRTAVGWPFPFYASSHFDSLAI
jgi:hypothetical protein